uniref:Uncharacterized protein n=1 Tax=Arundo donax TaxID=35708 RepID=A0A0A9B4Z5_ARUDO
MNCALSKLTPNSLAQLWVSSLYLLQHCGEMRKSLTGISQQNKTWAS